MTYLNYVFKLVSCLKKNTTVFRCKGQSFNDIEGKVSVLLWERHEK
jgi:hypothetical protein